MFQSKKYQDNRHSETLIQPALEIGAEDDDHEKEANAVADKVMCMPEKAGTVKRMTTKGESVRPMPVQPKKIMKARASSVGTMKAPPSVTKQLSSKSGSGNKLPGNLQQEMGEKIGADFSGVNLHTDNLAVQMNKEIGAKAFTYGNDIYFNAGQYNPGSPEGKHLLAHELTHTVQQSGERRIQRAPFKPDQKVTTGGGDWTTKQTEYRSIYSPVFSDDMSISLPVSYTPHGAVIKLRFNPNEEVKKNATQIALIQKVLTMDAQPDTDLEMEKSNKGKKKKKSEPVVHDGSNPIFKNGKVYLDEIEMNRATASGARIDKPSDEDNPIYSTEKTKYSEDPQVEQARNSSKTLTDAKDADVNHEAEYLNGERFGHQYNSKNGEKNFSDATLIDTPNIFTTWKHPAGQTFETAALVVDGDNSVKGKYLGSVSWGWRSTGKEVTATDTAEGKDTPITNGKHTELLDLTMVSQDFISDDFVEAATKWNESKTSNPNVETIDLPTTKK